MSEAKTTDEKTLKAKPKTLTLKKPVDAGAVRQNASAGRGRGVVVEKVKRRSVGASPEAPARVETVVARPKTVQTTVSTNTTPSGRAVKSNTTAPAKGAPEGGAGAGVVLRTLTEGEREARTRALVDARERALGAGSRAGCGNRLRGGPGWVRSGTCRRRPARHGAVKPTAVDARA